MATVKERFAEAPKGVEVKVEPTMITVKGPKGELKRYIQLEGIAVETRPAEGGGSEVVFKKEDPRRRELAYIGTVASHTQNMITGVTEGFTYKLKVVYAHFPINLSVEKDRLVIKNFIGEKTPRYAKIAGSTKVEIKGQDIILTGINLEDVSQTAGNIECATRIRKRDPRVFNDGIYITMKGEE